MNQTDVYVDMDGNPLSLAGLDAEERRLVGRLRRRARTHADWCDFDNYWMRVVPAFYDARGLPRAASVTKLPVRIAQDLSSRLGIAAGLIRPPDYLEDLEELIDKHFPSRREFCKAAGMAEDLLSRFLAGRKDLSLATLAKGLERVGFRLRIVPAPEQKPAARKQTG